MSKRGWLQPNTAKYDDFFSSSSEGIKPAVYPSVQMRFGEVDDLVMQGKQEREGGLFSGYFHCPSHL